MTTTSNSKQVQWREISLLAGLCAFFFFYGLSFFGLLGADEPRYAQVAREMLARRDWITPTLGGQPWMEKPALYYWQAIISFHIFGVSDWAARIPSALDTSLLVFTAYFFLRCFRSGSALDGALIVASSAAMIGFARAASTDMPLAAMFGMGMLAWYAWHQTGARLFLASFYVLIALGTLAKGPVAPILAIGVIGAFALMQSDLRMVWKALWLPGIVLFCVVALPWYIAVQLKNPDFFRVFILEHNFARFGTNLYRHKQPFWYYLPIAFVSLVPWMFFAIAGFFAALRTWFDARKQRIREADCWPIFLAVWLIVPIVFFSLSQSKLPGYILPAIPAGTLLVAEYVGRKIGAQSTPSLADRLLVVVHSVAVALLIVPALMIRYILLEHRMPWDKSAAIAFIIAAVFAIVMVIILRKRGLGMLRTMAMIPVVVALAIVLRFGTSTIDGKLSARPVAHEISLLEPKPLRVALYNVSRNTEFGLAFYRNAVIGRYESGQVPDDEHILVTSLSSQLQFASLIGGRRAIYLGNYPPQGLAFYWVAAK
jgi:4-amino-4-deoxy-L-arabinose transferase-like glycosyltransferase